MKTIREYMTPSPQAIGQEQPIQTGVQMMREHRIRHLPVQHGGRLVGVVSDRDLKLAASFKGATELTIEEVMTPDPYVVSEGDELELVAREMAEHKYGCAIVTAGSGPSPSHLKGIFTATDGLKALSDLLSERSRK